MKRIIKGKTYSTMTATTICEMYCADNCRDSGYHDTILYQTKKGQFFIAGEGGAASMWRVRVPNGHVPGDGLRLLDSDDAREIMEEAGCSNETFAEFGLAVEEG